MYCNWEAVSCLGHGGILTIGDWRGCLIMVRGFEGHYDFIPSKLLLVSSSFSPREDRDQSMASWLNMGL